jgi:hypothetical protein
MEANMDDEQIILHLSTAFSLRVHHFLSASRFMTGSETKVFLNIFVLSSATKSGQIQLGLEYLMDLTALSEGAVRRALHGLTCRGLIYNKPQSNRAARVWSVNYERLEQLGATLH